MNYVLFVTEIYNKFLSHILLYFIYNINNFEFVYYFGNVCLKKNFVRLQIKQ